MYKVKRFSQITEDYYQKEFGFNPIRYAVNKINPDLSRKLSNDINKARIRKLGILSKRSTGNGLGKPTSIPEIDSKLISLAENNNSSVINATIGGSKENFNTKVKDLPKGLLDHVKIKDPELHKALTSKKNAIFHPSGTSTEELAHEIGHVQNRNSRRIKDRLVSEADYYMRNSSQHNGKSGLLSSGLNYLKGKLKIIEETKASKKGLRNLRDAGGTSDQVRNAKNLYKENLETYKSSNELDYKIPLRDWLDKK